MKRVLVDKIASVAASCRLTSEIRLTEEIPCEEGVVLTVEVLDEKATYNQLELASGRMAIVRKGDLLVGALGHRKALFGYSGHVPESLRPGSLVHLLNLGGVLGECDDYDPCRGAPYTCKVLGAVLSFPFLGERIGIPARIGAFALDRDPALPWNGIPVIAIAGSCMDAGKTAAACAILGRSRDRGFIVDAFKATGVSARRDILAMEDAGARSTAIFTDFGVVTTTAANGPALAKTMLRRLATKEPDAILFELGDGLLGAYGVEAILDDGEIRKTLTAVVLSANDPVAAWGGVRILRERFGIEPTVVTGPSTDNAVGVEIIRERLHVRAANALTSGDALG
ncbi:MAG: hypothetical protein ACRD3V_11850, partial [Vicinamibacteria bacterium]